MRYLKSLTPIGIVFSPPSSKEHPNDSPRPTPVTREPTKNPKTDETNTHAVNIPTRRPPLRIPIPPIRDLLEPRDDIIIELTVLAEVKLVSVAVAIRPTGMTRLGAACDGHVASTGVLEGYGAFDCPREDSFVGGAFGVGFGGAAAGGDGRDSGGLETGLRLGLGKGGAGAFLVCGERGSGEGQGEEGGEIWELWGVRWREDEGGRGRLNFMIGGLLSGVFWGVGVGLLVGRDVSLSLHRTPVSRRSVNTKVPF